MSNDGKRINYDANLLMNDMFFERAAVIERDKIIESLKNQCLLNMIPGETKYIALSPNETKPGTDIFSSQKPWYENAELIPLNPRSFIAINNTEATIYAECICDAEGKITITYDYYIWDYYDWDPGEDGLYSLNTFNYACNFFTIGKMQGMAFTHSDYF